MNESRLTVVEHPLVQHKLSYLRDKDTPTVHFRKLANEITLLLTYEATKDFSTENAEIETPLERMTAQRISGKKVAVCPVLRAGVGMLDGVLSLVSSARVGFVGLYRDEETLEAVQYYLKLPDDLSERDAIVLDPMLATGHSSCAAIAAVKDAGAQSVTLVCIVAAPPPRTTTSSTSWTSISASSGARSSRSWSSCCSRRRWEGWRACWARSTLPAGGA